MIDCIDTPRLRLRRPRLEDAASVAHALNDIEVAGKLSRVPFPYGFADAESWLALQVPNLLPQHTNFAIETEETSLVGVVGFHDDVPGTTLGYWLAPSAWGRGIMTEAASAALGWYFRLTGADRVYSGAFDFNQASLAVQRKLGFTQTGVSTRHCLARDQVLRHIDTLLTRDAWTERKIR